MRDMAETNSSTETERFSDRSHKKKKKHKRKSSKLEHIDSCGVTFEEGHRQENVGRANLDSDDESQPDAKKKKSKKRKRDKETSEHHENGEDVARNNIRHTNKNKKKDKKHKRDKDPKSKDVSDGNDMKRGRKSNEEDQTGGLSRSIDGTHVKKEEQNKKYFPFEYEHILAPMVGASELAFRLLCRKYGATLAYTPMMSASQFIEEAAGMKSSNSSTVTVANSNICEFQTIPEDRPLVCHFSANNPQHFAKAASLVEPFCDAIDLNLGCPQRTAYVGHFGSYLLGEEDRNLVLDIIRAGRKAVSIPIFVKIRLLDTIDETIKLCHQLRDAGASLIAIHARYRATWERTGPGARDGPALLDQVALVKKSMPDFPIIANGNVITYEDVVSNRRSTKADGIMSAEGILNDPAIYLQRFGDINVNKDMDIRVQTLSPLIKSDSIKQNNGFVDSREKLLRKLNKKLRKIDSIEKKLSGGCSLDDDQQKLLSAKSSILSEIKKLENIKSVQTQECITASTTKMTSMTMKLGDLFKAGTDKLALAKEYLSLVRRYPTKIRSVVFHTRRMCKDLLEQYQLMEECIACTSIDEVDAVLSKCASYIKHPDTFHFDLAKAAREKDALERKKREEGKRKAYEARMIRKAKREGLADLEHYLRIGAEVPTKAVINKLKSIPRDEALAVWKKNHSQHCMSYHLDAGGCKRDRACAFLHVEAKDGNIFDEVDEVAG